jgi:uncharacterized protein (DUF2236 family)
VTLHNPNHSRQAKAGSFSDLLCGKERIENLFDHLRRNPRAGVRDAEDEVRPELSARVHAGKVLVHLDVLRAYRNRAAIRQRVARIHAQIEQH